MKGRVSNFGHLKAFGSELARLQVVIPLVFCVILSKNSPQILRWTNLLSINKIDEYVASLLLSLEVTENMF